MSLYQVKRLPEVDREAEHLSLVLKRRLRENLEYLRSGPHRSYPWLQVKELRDLRGVWRGCARPSSILTTSAERKGRFAAAIAALEAHPVARA